MFVMLVQLKVTYPLVIHNSSYLMCPLFLASLTLKYKLSLQFPAAAPSCPERCLEHCSHSVTIC